MDEMFAALCYFLIGMFFSLLTYIYFCSIYKYNKVKEPWCKWSAKKEVGDITFLCGLLWPFTLFFSIICLIIWTIISLGSLIRKCFKIEDED